MKIGYPEANIVIEKLLSLGLDEKALENYLKEVYLISIGRKGGRKFVTQKLNTLKRMITLDRELVESDILF